MWSTNKTAKVLDCYLRQMAVKVSRARIQQLLNTPVGNTIRGMSDALDELRINNAVYQLPSEYFNELEIPFIAALHSSESPFCVVEKKNDTAVSITDSDAIHRIINKDLFLRKWTGAVLIGEKTDETVSERNLGWKNIITWVNDYKGFIAGVLLFFSSLIVIGCESSLLFIHTLIVWLGIVVSIVIIYKENYNPDFLRRFCQIGEMVDCNRVLHSRGGTLLGVVQLGELSLIFFGTLLLYAILNQTNFQLMTAIGLSLACVFTVYSVIYQAFVVRKWCMLCLCVNLIIWVDAIWMYTMREALMSSFDWLELLGFGVLFVLCSVLGLELKQLLETNKENTLLKDRFASLLQPDIFNRLLLGEQELTVPIGKELLLHNGIESNELDVIIFTNPNCSNCARVHPQIQLLSKTKSVGLVLFVSSDDKIGKFVAQQVIACYFSEGWSKAIELLGKWFENKNLNALEVFSVQQHVREMLTGQQRYCEMIRLAHTPSVVVNTHYLPLVYEVSDLKYVI